MLNKTILSGLITLSLLLFSHQLFAISMEQCSDLLQKFTDLEARYITTFKKSDYEGVIKLKKERNALAELRQECLKKRDEARRKRECENLVKYRDGVLKDKIALAGNKNSMKKLKHYHHLAADLRKDLNLLLEETWYERNVNAASRIYKEVADRTLELTSLITGDETIDSISSVYSYVQLLIAEVRGMASNKDRVMTAAGAVKDPALGAATDMAIKHMPDSKITEAFESGAVGDVVGGIMALDGLKDSVKNISDHSVQQEDLKSQVEKYADNLRKQIKLLEDKFKKEKGNYKEKQKLKKLSDDITKKCP